MGLSENRIQYDPVTIVHFGPSKQSTLFWGSKASMGLDQPRDVKSCVQSGKAAVSSKVDVSLIDCIKWI